MVMRFAGASTLRPVAASLLAAATLLVPAAPALCQDAKPQYKTMTVPKELTERTSARYREASRGYIGVLTGEAPLDEAGKRILDDWFVHRAFAMMTRMETLSELVNARKAFFKTLGRAKAEPAHAYMNEITLATMTKIAGDNYHPAVRHNAMLVIGQLNQREEVAGSMGSPAVPLGIALTAPGGLVATAGNANAPAVVRVAALVGILRHAETGGGIAGTNQTAVLSAMANILKEKPAPGSSPDADVWLKMRAADVCGAIKTANTSVMTELANTVAEPSAPVMLRCAAAQALGNLKSLDANAVKAADLAANLGNLQLELCREELDRATASGALSPRQIHFRTSCVQKALLGDGKVGGIARTNDAGAKPLVDGISKTTTEILALVPDENAQPTDELKAKADELEKLLAAANVLRVKPEEAPAAAPTTPKNPAPKNPAPANPAATTPAAAPATVTPNSPASAPAATP